MNSPQMLMLLQVKDRLLSSGVPFVEDVSLEEQSLSAFDGQITVEAPLVEFEESQLHSHIIVYIKGRENSERTQTLEACLVGIGKSLEEAINEAAELWLQLVGAPILSFLSGRPVLWADHFEGNEEWGVPGGHGFVGPVGARGFTENIDFDELHDQVSVARLFAYDRYPRDGHLHIVKVTLLLRNENWERHIEIDGHKQSFIDDEWNEIPPTGGMAIFTRFAIFFFEKTRDGDTALVDKKQFLDDSAPFLKAIDLVADARELNDEEMENLLIEQGFQEDDAFWLTRFIPAAYARAWLEPEGLTFHDDFDVMKVDTREAISMKFSQQAIWKSVFRNAKKELATGIDKNRLISIAGRSSEYHAVRDLLNQNSGLKDVRLTKLILLDYR